MADKSTAPIPNAPVDTVHCASRRPDGTPDQTPGFKFHDTDMALEVTKQQLATMAVNAVDAAEQADRIAEEAGSSEPDPPGKKRLAAHEAAVKSAHARAEAEVGRK